MKVNIIKKEIVFEKYFKIEEAKLQFEKFDGNMSNVITRLNFDRGDSVAAIIFNIDTNKAYFVNQFKYPCYSKHGGWITEVVAGIIDEGETPEEAIKREILEEIGYNTLAIEKISTFFVSPGGSSERIFLYLAKVDNSQKIDNGGGLISENEDIKLVEYSLVELSQMINKDEIKDAKTIIAINHLLKSIN
jgi:nudix-type nucleoside diphosphatase (YffH/AdpP family)